VAALLASAAVGGQPVEPGGCKGPVTETAQQAPVVNPLQPEAEKGGGPPGRRPNIVWIWADNLAYRDVGCFGSPTIRTPTFDGLARDGVRLSRYYVAHVVCSPSRAALLTGRQPFRAGVTDVLRPDSPTGLPADEVTIAELLHGLGYATLALGKWHLGDRPQFLPTRHGFDHYLGLPYSMDMAPTLLIRDERVIAELPGAAAANVTERLVDEAIRFVTTNRERPFFLYLAHTIPHPPLTVPASARTPGRPIYEDAVEYMDRQTGRLLEALDRLGLAGETLVVFTSDNGPMARDGDAGGLRGRIGQSYEGGVRVPFVARFPGKIPAGRVVTTPVIAYDMFPTLVNLAGGQVPRDRTYDGQDVWPLLTGQAPFTRQQPFVWVFDDNITAVLDPGGRWKLHLGSGETTFARPELYDLENDRAEAHNLAEQHPAIVQRLTARTEKLRKDIPKVWKLKYPVRDPLKARGGVRRQ
jgi:uncharacterized sulfatase